MDNTRVYAVVVGSAPTLFKAGITLAAFERVLVLSVDPQSKTASIRLMRGLDWETSPIYLVPSECLEILKLGTLPPAENADGFLKKG